MSRYKNLMKNILIIFFFLLFSRLSARNISVTPIPTIGQLPVSAIHRVFQDNEGYMWYGTVNGLCRDDGYQVQVFRSDINTPGLLKNNLVQCITEDNDRKIWFGTDNGAYILDKKDYSITPLDTVHLKDKGIYRIYSTSDGCVWVSIMGQCLKYDIHGKLLKSYPTRNRDESTFVLGFCESRQGDIYLSFNNGHLYNYNKKKDCLCLISVKMRHLNPTIIIQDIKENYFWLATWGDGIARFDPHASRDSILVYQPMPITSTGKKDGTILYIAQDDTYHYLWATTLCDLVAYSSNKGGQLSQTDVSFLFPVSNLMLNEIIRDHFGNMWVSAFDRQSFIIHFNDNFPRCYTLPALRQRVDYNPAVMSISECGDNMVWLSQERSGVFLYDLVTNKLCSYKDSPATRNLSLSSSKEMEKANLLHGVWVVPEYTLSAYCLVRKSMNILIADSVNLVGKAVSGSFIKKVFEDKSDRLWLGTTNGLYCYDTHTKKISSISSSIGMVTAIRESDSGEIWVLTDNNGFFRISSDGKLHSYSSALSFSSFAFTTDGYLWMGTEDGGLYLFNPRTNQRINYTLVCGLNGNQINQLVVDEFNHLWIDTNQKLIEFNVRNKSFSTYYFNTDKPHLLSRLIPTAVCVGEDGYIYFGGIPGICRVKPSNLLDRESSPVKTLITNVKVMGNSIIFLHKNNKNNLLHIVLQPGTRNLEIDFSSLDYLNASKIRYAYRLKGLDNEWTYTLPGCNYAHYNRLPKGNYVFEVKATDANGLWSNKITSLHICRFPYFYETRWAYLIYIVLAAGILIGAVYVFIRHQNRKNEELYSDSKELLKMRNYLTNIPVSDIEYEQLDDLFMKKIIQVVEDNLSESDFNVAMLAEKVNMSRSTLTRKLKDITGRTPLDFIRQVKMKHARQMLEDRNKTIYEVALMIGYFDRKYFTSCFKQEFGMTPSEYQKHLK
ncbi:MAG: helix-turn-helix domain-containing protein [Bacteroidaceae bacterium]|nr:helix-turn-helix domain-containing protein [Bacteroidaceae bacterium]